MTREAFLSYIDAYNAGDFTSVATYYTHDVIFESLGHIHSGPQVMQFLEQLHHGVSDKMTPVKLQIDGNHIEMEVDTHIVALVDLPNLPAGAMQAGEQRTVRMYASYETRDNKICRVRITGQPAQP